MSATRGHTYLETDADVGVRAWGATLADAFAELAAGALAVAVRPESVVPSETREVRAQADSVERLAVAWINECLYVHEVEGFAVGSVSVSRVEGGVAHGLLHGEPLEPTRHHLGTAVKAATLHDVEVCETPGRVEIQVVLDV